MLLVLLCHVVNVFFIFIGILQKLLNKVLFVNINVVVSVCVGIGTEEILMVNTMYYMKWKQQRFRL